jgi:hypothetical protein
MKELPNVYKTAKLLMTSYENRKRGYLLRRESGAIDRDTEFRLVQELDCNVKREIDDLARRIDSGEFDSEAEPDVVESKASEETEL